MISKISAFSPINAPKSFLNNASKICFRGNDDIVSFSDYAKERMKIIDELKSIGFSLEDAHEVINKLYNNNELYDKLVNGIEENGKIYPVHHINREGNLTPTEALLYIAFDMDNYYKSRQDSPLLDSTTINARSYDLGENNIPPLELAKYMYEGFDAVISGMLAKGKLKADDAEKTQEYYLASNDTFEDNNNLREAEYTAFLLSQNLDRLDYLTSEDKDEKGNLKNGLTRPLTKEEAVILVKNDYLRQDTKALNNYIAMNEKFGVSLYTMDLRDLWDKNPEEIVNRPKNIVKSKIKRNVQDFDELVYIVGATYPSLNREVLSDIKMLDNGKFFGRYPAQAIKFDAINCQNDDRELRQKNIQVLNNISEELLNKMTSGSANVKKGHFSSLIRLFRTKDLSQRVQTLEEYRINTPEMFNSMTRETVMDYLTDSDAYTRQEKALKLFLDMLSGCIDNIDDEDKSAEIIKFPTDKE